MITISRFYRIKELQNIIASTGKTNYYYQRKHKLHTYSAVIPGWKSKTVNKIHGWKYYTLFYIQIKLFREKLATMCVCRVSLFETNIAHYFIRSNMVTNASVGIALR